MRQQNIRKLINTYSQHNRTKQQFHTELSKRWIDGSIFFMQLFHNFVWAHSTFMVVSVTCLFFLCRQSLVCMYPSLVLYVVLNNQNLMLIANSMLVINGADKVCVISQLESFVFIKCFEQSKNGTWAQQLLFDSVLLIFIHTAPIHSSCLNVLYCVRERLANIRAKPQ